MSIAMASGPRPTILNSPCWNGYRTADYDAVMADTSALLRTLAVVAGKADVAWRGVTCDVSAEPERLTVQGAFARHADGIDL